MPSPVAPRFETFPAPVPHTFGLAEGFACGGRQPVVGCGYDRSAQSAGVGGRRMVKKLMILVVLAALGALVAKKVRDA